jgi:phosphoribosylaminoimidazolecarboxamide formyltransferase/IMP cyclohydrolase
LAFSKAQDLRYGENPHQKAALYSAFASGGKNPLLQRKKLWGKELSYNNLLDIEAAVDLALEFHGNTAAVIIKHNNPCGVAIRTTGEDAFVTALSTDSKSAFGGVICFTQPVDSPEAKKVSELFTEVVIAPSFSSGALALLEAKRNVRIIEEPLLSQGMPHGELEMRGIRGGLLVQQKNDLLYSKERKTVAKRAPTDAELAGLDFAWRVCKHVKSNAVVYAKDNRTVGVGAGQMSRVDCVKIASMKAKDAGLDTTGCVMASDAFFPFRDAVDEAAKAGITAIIQPGGSIRDAEVIAAADAHGIAMVFTGIRQTWH